MAQHRIALRWTGGGKPFTYESYPREHEIVFKEGRDRMTASASPAYRGDGLHGDPEDLLVAALSSCHMLSFLAVCSKKKIRVDSYEDDAVGLLEDDGGKLWIKHVTLRPRVAADADTATLNQVHHLAHQACFIANSVRTEIAVEPQ